MDAARWERVESLFHEARRLPVADRRSFLEARSGGDMTIVDDVLSLLEEDSRSSSLLDGQLADVAAIALGGASPAARTIGPYRVGRLLGEGGMGIVFEAERADLGTVAAIKFLRDAWLSPARRERFASEQRTLAQLNHPSIARLYDADTLPDGTPWIVMELVDGTPITEYCRARASPLVERLRLLRAVCEAVQHAHRHAIIHRDLKPSNILVSADGAVKLLDFGIAKHLASGDAAADVTRTSSRFMTPAYAAPEQHRNESIGIYTDVYSLGVLLYELLAERPPFDLADRTPAEVETIVSRQEPMRPSVAASPELRARLGKAAWADLDVLCLTAMHKDPHRRYRTVEALIRDIDHYLAGEPLEARPDSARYRFGKFVRRNARAVSAAAAVLVFMIALTVFYTLRLASARDSALAEAARTQRLQQFMMNLFQGGTSAASPAESLRVLTLVERGVQTAHGLDAEPGVQADLYETLGILNRELGNFPRADTLLRAALNRRQALYGPTHRSVASSMVALAELRSDQAAFEEAERLAREGLELARRALGPQHLAVARATTVLGEVLVNRGQYASAIPVLEEAVALHSAGREPTQDLAVALGLLANAHFYAGQYAVSDTINRRLLILDRQLYGERHPRVAHDLINLGAIQFEGQTYGEAERFYREALAIMREWYGNDHPETASALTMVARTLISQQRPDEAVGLLGQALMIYERVYGPVHPRVASALNELGRVARNQKRFDEAESYFRRMTDIYREVYDDKHYLIGVGMSNLAGVHHERGAYAEAERLFRDVLRRYAEVLAPEHNLVGIAKVRLGRTLVAARRDSEAETELRAGLDILLRQPTPPASWVANAKEDLAAIEARRGQQDR